MNREDVLKARAETIFPETVYVHEEYSGGGDSYLEMQTSLLESVDKEPSLYKEPRLVAEYRLVRCLMVHPVKVEELK